jgi:hypothetical protein
MKFECEYMRVHVSSLFELMREIFMFMSNSLKYIRVCVCVFVCVKERKTSFEGLADKC